jgi:hypothetical protein
MSGEGDPCGSPQNRCAWEIDFRRKRAARRPSNSGHELRRGRRGRRSLNARRERDRCEACQIHAPVGATPQHFCDSP